MTSRATTIQRPRPLTKQRLSERFWALARGSGAETQSRDPEAVVRHLLAVILVLQGDRRNREISAESLSFLLQLEHDPYYASPEQTRGGEKDGQSLVYSIGVLLFERLTGHHPFVESLSPMHCAIVRDRGRRIGANNLASIPRDLRAIINTALLPFPEDRWDDVSDLRRELAGFLGRAETVLAPLPHERGASHPVPSRATTQQHRRELPTLERQQPGMERRLQSTIDGTPRRRLADGTGPHHRRRRRRSTPPPPPGSAERARSESFPEIIIEGGADARADSPDLSDSINQISSVDLSAIISRPRRPSNALVIAGLVVVLISVVATVVSMFVSESRAATLRPAPSRAVQPRPAVSVPAPKPEVVAKPVAPADDETAETAKPVPSVFDIHHAGELAVTAARTCFGPGQLNRGLEVGATLLFSSKTGEATRVYLAAHMKANASQRSCLARKLTGISAGAPPRHGTLVTYTLFLDKNGGRASARLRK